MSTDYRSFLALSYEQLEELNLAAKADRFNRVPADEIREKRIKYLTDEKRVKAVTVVFSDLEGRLHLLDYDKKFLLGSYENLTFDGSSIRCLSPCQRALSRPPIRLFRRSVNSCMKCRTTKKQSA